MLKPHIVKPLKNAGLPQARTESFRLCFRCFDYTTIARITQRPFPEPALPFWVGDFLGKNPPLCVPAWGYGRGPIPRKQSCPPLSTPKNGVYRFFCINLPIHYQKNCGRMPIQTANKN